MDAIHLTRRTQLKDVMENINLNIICPPPYKQTMHLKDTCNALTCTAVHYQNCLTERVCVLTWDDVSCTNVGNVSCWSFPDPMRMRLKTLKDVILLGTGSPTNAYFATICCNRCLLVAYARRRPANVSVFLFGSAGSMGSAEEGVKLYETPRPRTIQVNIRLNPVTFARGPLFPKTRFWACYRFFIRRVVLGQESSILKNCREIDVNLSFWCSFDYLDIFPNIVQVI